MYRTFNNAEMVEVEQTERTEPKNVIFFYWG